MKRIITLLALSFYSHFALPCSKDHLKQIEARHYQYNVDSLKRLYGKNKEIPKTYERQILIALSHYPELANTHIRFEQSAINTTLNVRPSISSMFLHNTKEREYIIRINNQQEDSVINISQVPFEAQIGLFGHEFSHIVDYSQKGFWGMFGRLISYLSEKTKKDYERQTDRLTIVHGLGLQLQEWSHFVLYESKAKVTYKKYKMYNYMQPQEIAEYMVAKQKL